MMRMALGAPKIRQEEGRIPQGRERGNNSNEPN